MYHAVLLFVGIALVVTSPYADSQQEANYTSALVRDYIHGADLKKDFIQILNGDSGETAFRDDISTDSFENAIASDEGFNEFDFNSFDSDINGEESFDSFDENSDDSQFESMVEGLDSLENSLSFSEAAKDWRNSRQEQESNMSQDDDELDDAEEEEEEDDDDDDDDDDSDDKKNSVRMKRSMSVDSEEEILGTESDFADEAGQEDEEDETDSVFERNREMEGIPREEDFNVERLSFQFQPSDEEQADSDLLSRFERFAGFSPSESANNTRRSAVEFSEEDLLDDEDTITESFLEGSDDDLASDEESELESAFSDEVLTPGFCDENKKRNFIDYGGLVADIANLHERTVSRVEDDFLGDLDCSQCIDMDDDIFDLQYKDDVDISSHGRCPYKLSTKHSSESFGSDLQHKNMHSIGNAHAHSSSIMDKRSSNLNYLTKSDYLCNEKCEIAKRSLKNNTLVEQLIINHLWNSINKDIKYHRIPRSSIGILVDGNIKGYTTIAVNLVYNLALLFSRDSAVSLSTFKDCVKQVDAPVQMMSEQERDTYSYFSKLKSLIKEGDLGEEGVRNVKLALNTTISTVEDNAKTVNSELKVIILVVNGVFTGTGEKNENLEKIRDQLEEKNITLYLVQMGSKYEKCQLLALTRESRILITHYVNQLLYGGRGNLLNGDTPIEESSSTTIRSVVPLLHKKIFTVAQNIEDKYGAITYYEGGYVGWEHDLLNYNDISRSETIKRDEIVPITKRKVIRRKRRRRKGKKGVTLPTTKKRRTLAGDWHWKRYFPSLQKGILAEANVVIMLDTTKNGMMSVLQKLLHHLTTLFPVTLSKTTLYAVRPIRDKVHVKQRTFARPEDVQKLVVTVPSSKGVVVTPGKSLLKAINPPSKLLSVGGKNVFFLILTHKVQDFMTYKDIGKVIKASNVILYIFGIGLEEQKAAFGVLTPIQRVFTSPTPYGFFSKANFATIINQLKTDVGTSEPVLSLINNIGPQALAAKSTPKMKPKSRKRPKRRRRKTGRRGRRGRGRSTIGLRRRIPKKPRRTRNRKSRNRKSRPKSLSLPKPSKSILAPSLVRIPKGVVGPTNIAIVVDETFQNMASVKTYIRTLLSTFQKEGTYVSLATFGMSFKIHAHFEQFMNNRALNRAVDKIKGKPGRYRNTGQALMEIRRKFNSADPNYPLIILLILNGPSSDDYATPARMLRDEGLDVIVIVNGNSVGSKEVTSIQSSTQLSFRIGFGDAARPVLKQIPFLQTICGTRRNNYLSRSGKNSLSSINIPYQWSWKISGGGIIYRKIQATQITTLMDTTATPNYIGKLLYNIEKSFSIKSVYSMRSIGRPDPSVKKLFPFKRHLDHLSLQYIMLSFSNNIYPARNRKKKPVANRKGRRPKRKTSRRRRQRRDVIDDVFDTLDPDPKYVVPNSKYNGNSRRPTLTKPGGTAPLTKNRPAYTPSRPSTKVAPRPIGIRKPSSERNNNGGRKPTSNGYRNSNNRPITVSGAKNDASKASPANRKVTNLPQDEADDYLGDLMGVSSFDSPPKNSAPTTVGDLSDAASPQGSAIGTQRRKGGRGRAGTRPVIRLRRRRRGRRRRSYINRRYVVRWRTWSNITYQLKDMFNTLKRVDNVPSLGPNKNKAALIVLGGWPYHHKSEGYSNTDDAGFKAWARRFKNNGLRLIIIVMQYKKTRNVYAQEILRSHADFFAHGSWKKPQVTLKRFQVEASKLFGTTQVNNENLKIVGFQDRKRFGYSVLPAFVPLIPPPYEHYQTTNFMVSIQKLKNIKDYSRVVPGIKKNYLGGRLNVVLAVDVTKRDHVGILRTAITNIVLLFNRKSVRFSLMLVGKTSKIVLKNYYAGGRRYHRIAKRVRFNRNTRIKPNFGKMARRLYGINKNQLRRARRTLVIVIAQDRSGDDTKVKPKNLKNSGVLMAAIGIGERVNKPELQMLASSGQLVSEGHVSMLPLVLYRMQAVLSFILKGPVASSKDVSVLMASPMYAQQTVFGNYDNDSPFKQRALGTKNKFTSKRDEIITNNTALLNVTTTAAPARLTVSAMPESRYRSENSKAQLLHKE